MRLRALLWPRPWISPHGLVLTALVVAALYLLADVAGLRPHTAVLSGNAAGVGATLLGLAYVALHLCTWIVAPVLALGGLVLWGLVGLVGRRGRANG